MLFPPPPMNVFCRSYGQVDQTSYVPTLGPSPGGGPSRESRDSESDYSETRCTLRSAEERIRAAPAMVGGRFRCLTKPFKRWAFAKGVEFTQTYSRYFINKYLLKFLRKYAKIAGSAVCVAGRSEHRESIALAASVTNILLGGERENSGKVVTRLPRDELCAALRAAINESLKEKCEAQARPHMMSGTQTGPFSPMKFIRSSTCLDVRARERWADEFVDFAVGLGEAVDKNLGLDHSKVREYWLQRGPRLLVTATVFFIFTIVCQETLKMKVANNDRIYTLAVNGVAFVIAIVLLYYRLPDSIEASISRTAHDFYVEYKRKKGEYRETADGAAHPVFVRSIDQTQTESPLVVTIDQTETEPKFSVGLYLGSMTESPPADTVEEAGAPGV